ncbi:phosphoribosyl 1,2-cyclic phosphodiesterase [Dysgonomonas sp. PH5-45]|uniref:MBL fold metallo-hydrolase n=1 Tax=unclassified Dysgonomonas TaxID=2630389 RepID=UPI002473FC18|nr:MULTISPECIES: MBL fold metallo-hydrolase [unclassified Dysgonomonas]MDH6355585.1 phosphoribosyl 1,2-cyclic phosphodiesterase [Dysgonomonas sp. PH5-45]MDH6388505.1 phosphoribosyl 1,2-cyclic phosphodiesterase [Dysgonomonas sp. PH5-37]
MQLDLFSKQTNFRLLSLSSGSSGNCYYLGTPEYGILIDAGIGFRTVRKYLREYGIAIETIIGVLVTHDHADHIKNVAPFANKMHVPVYATEAVHAGIERSHYVENLVSTSRRIICKDEAFAIRGFTVTAFDVPHDTIENVGYQITFEGKTVVLITDVGRITETITHYASTANHLIMESNYDDEMLRFGRYPEYLKRRITSGSGHLSNRLSGNFIASIYTPTLEEVWLCHLSNDNNHPQLAYKTVETCLANSGIEVNRDVKLKTLNRGKPSDIKLF